MNSTRHSLWMRFTESVRRGDVLERLWAHLTYTPESELEPLLRRLLGSMRNPVIFEFGACHGNECRMLCGMLTSPFSAYFAWEPDPRTLLRIHARGLPAGVVLVEAAVGATDGKATFHLSEGYEEGSTDCHTYSSSIVPPSGELKKWFPWMQFKAAVEVNVRSLDSFCLEHKIDHIDFIWADIQGAERYMLEGGRESLKQTKYMYIEQTVYRYYEGQWTYREMVRALKADWKVAYRFPNDVLLYNKNLVPHGPPK